MKDWIEIATEMFFKYRNEITYWNPDNQNCKELMFIAAGKAIALMELLTIFNSRPEIPKEDSR
jgi:hypothetical protein